MTLPLFDNSDAVETPSRPAVVVRTETRFGVPILAWRCPHCDDDMWADADGEDETPATIVADPACCRCRAEYASAEFAAWLRLPLAERMCVLVPADWRSARRRVDSA